MAISRIVLNFWRFIAGLTLGKIAPLLNAVKRMGTEIARPANGSTYLDDSGFKQIVEMNESDRLFPAVSQDE